MLVLLPEFGDWPAALWLVDEGDCVWAELVDEGFEVCGDPVGAVLDDVGLVVEAGEFAVEGVGVVVESCCRCADGALVEVLGEDWAKAEVAMATKAVVTNNKRLFI
ncbi:hypothetical protein [Bradyrhizobium genosp. L]|uniref:hypothetical protein n=1 Tax=Bradyrhizobium genosp. L TaxID=83637 RepID=UPI0032DEE4F0